MWSASGEKANLGPNSSFWSMAISGEELNYGLSEANIASIWGNECFGTEGGPGWHSTASITLRLVHARLRNLYFIW